MDCIVHEVAKRKTGLSDFHFTSDISLAVWGLSCGTQDLPCSMWDRSLQGAGVSSSVIASQGLNLSAACGIMAP